VVIAGTSPGTLIEQKSFELYRNGLVDVLVLTYDELLTKLRTLLELLRNPDATNLVVPTVTVKSPSLVGSSASGGVAADGNSTDTRQP
jgi:NADPH-dependent 7-cyano-7-deazaguanine reductase QueF-like protein